MSKDNGMTDTDDNTVAKLFLDIHATLSDIRGSLKSQEERMRRRVQAAAKKAEMPRDIIFSMDAVVPASGFVLATTVPSGPDQGYVWLVRQLWIGRGDASPNTALAGTGALFVTTVSLPQALAGQTSPFAPAGIRQSWGSFPQSLTFTGRTIVVKAQEQLWFSLIGGTAAQVVHITGTAEQEQEAAVDLAWDYAS